MTFLWYPPILVYHRISPSFSTDTPALHPSTFERQMALLSKRWNPIPLKSLVSYLEGKGALPKRAVVVTFDDGEETTFTHAFPILLKYRIPATVFMITSNVDKPDSLKKEQILQMAHQGVSFGSHTVNHAYLPSMPLDRAKAEIRESKENLEELGLAIEFLSYPAGGFTKEIQKIVQEAGYRAALTTNRGFQRLPLDRWALRRITMHATRSPFGIRIRASGYYGLFKALRSPF